MCSTAWSAGKAPAIPLPQLARAGHRKEWASCTGHAASDHCFACGRWRSCRAAGLVSQCGAQSGRDCVSCVQLYTGMATIRGLAALSDQAADCVSCSAAADNGVPCRRGASSQACWTHFWGVSIWKGDKGSMALAERAGSPAGGRGSGVFAAGSLQLKLCATQHDLANGHQPLQSTTGHNSLLAAGHLCTTAWPGL